jgi:FemAB-related protein (PEP-CTERM system-associated)
MIEIHTPSPSLSVEWDAYVAGKKNATIHHLSAWTTIAERAYDLRVRLLVARDAAGAPVRGVLPLVTVPRPLGRYLTTGLFGAYGPILADHEIARRELLHVARRSVEDEGASYLHLKSFGEGPTPDGFRRYDLWVTAFLGLEGGSDRLWRSFTARIRTAVRQANRHQLELRSGRDQLDAFYEVLAENMHRKGAPIYGRRFMSMLLDTLGPRADIVTLWHDGTPISGALTIAYNDVMYVPFASSRVAYFRMRPNNLLYWRIIERACDAGLRVLDFGTSLSGTTALGFKLGWGAVTQPVPSYVYARTNEPPALTADSAGARAGVALLKKLPRTVADMIGPSISRLIV